MSTVDAHHGRAAQALEAAGIPPARRGPERTRRLSARERDLYRWILERFAQAAPPDAAAVARFARDHGLEPDQALARLADEDLVHTGADGSVSVAYPFSARPRGHRVLIDDRRWVEAMCAIDALGIAPMLDLPIEITSKDPVSGAEIWVRLDPAEGAWWEPQSAVVLAGSTCCDGPSVSGCCDVLSFFEQPETAERYLREHADVAGLPISIPEAIEAGRALFGDIFEEA